jgi:outer membrane protein assembly factor BamA
MRYPLLTCGFLWLLSGSLQAQDTVRTRKVKVLPVPAFGYSPETRTYVGAVCLFSLDLYPDTTTRISNAKVEFNYTWNKQIITEIGWNYFFKEEKWFTKGLIHFSKYPDLYYGIGTHTPDSNLLTYNTQRIAIDLQGLKKIGKQLFTGVNMKYIHFGNLTADSSREQFPELKDGQTFGLGYSFVKDARNNILTPENGIYLYLNTTYNFSQKDYLEVTADARYYKTWKKRITLANRFINDFNFGNPNFFDQAFLGGDKFVRGYYYGRFRDNHLSSLQTEVRVALVWRLGLSFFGGLSNLYAPQRPFHFADTKYNAGIGLRFLVDKKERTNLRFDYAIGQDGNSGFYVSFGESF